MEQGDGEGMMLLARKTNEEMWAIRQALEWVLGGTYVSPVLRNRLERAIAQIDKAREALSVKDLHRPIGYMGDTSGTPMGPSDPPDAPSIVQDWSDGDTLPDAPPNRQLATHRLRVAIQNAIHKLDAGATKSQIRLALTNALDDHRRSMAFVVYCDERAIDVAAVYANAGYPLPPNPTLTREQILRESDAGMDRTLIFSTGRVEDRVGVKPNEAVPLFDGMRFYTVPPAHY